MYDSLNDRVTSGDIGGTPLASSPTPENDAAPATAAASDKPAVVEEVVIEEVSIDGMCGVY